MSLRSLYAVKNDLIRSFGSDSLLKSGDRALLWRIFINVIPCVSFETDADLGDHVCKTLSKLTADYISLKDKSLPTMDKVVADPLGAGGDSDGGVDSNVDGNDEWSAYHTSLATMEDIKMDLDRLYITGIVDEYFEKPHRISLLSNVLLLWACRNKEIAYRQGMHEVAACLLYAVEEELVAYNSDNTGSTLFPKDKILPAISEPDAVEAHTYWLFDHVMMHLSPLYDPEAKKKGSETNTNVVHFCCAIQQQALQEIDPDLYLQLENCSVYPQIYGMRWTRLMFSREMPMVATHGLRVWDYLLAQCFRVKALESSDSNEHGSLFSDVDISTDDSASNVFSEYLSSVSNSSAENSIFPSSSGRSASMSMEDKKRYGYKSTVLVYVGHVALSMIEHVREQCLSGSMNEALSALMRFPTVNDEEVVEILQRANSIANDTFVIDSSHRAGGTGTGDMHTGGKVDGKATNNTTRPTWLAAPQNNTHLKSTGYTNSFNNKTSITKDESNTNKVIGSSEALEQNITTKIANIPAKASQIAVKGIQTVSRGIDKLRGSIIGVVRGTGKAKEEDTASSSGDSFIAVSNSSSSPNKLDISSSSASSTLTEDVVEQKQETQRINTFNANARKPIDDEDILKDTSSSSSNMELVDDILGSMDASFGTGTRNNIFRSGTKSQTDRVPPSDGRASTSGIATRIIDVADGMKVLGKKSGLDGLSNQIVKSRADAAKKLRQLADFLEGPETGLMQEYDQLAYGAKKSVDSSNKGSSGDKNTSLANDDLFSLLLEK